MTTQTLADLRTPALTGHNWETAAAYCPVCGCSKNGALPEPNRQTEACQRAACRCHDENAVERNPDACDWTHADTCGGASGPCMDEPLHPDAVRMLASLRTVPVTTPPFRCRCGATTFCCDEEQRAAQPDGAHKCATCHTFSTDHAWRGDWSDPSDNASPRCWDCDIRFGSHR